MAETLGGIASVLTLLESIAHVTKYIRSCKNAPQESQHLVRELSYVRGLLTTLKETIEEQESSSNAWSSTLLQLDDTDGPLLHFQQLLELLQLRIGGASQQKGLKRIKMILEWPFKESETLKLINVIERYKGLFKLALENNHIRLSKAISDDIKTMSTVMQEIKGELQHSTRELQTLNLKTQEVQGALQLSSHQLETINTRSEDVHTQVQKSVHELRSMNLKNEDSQFREIFQWLSSWNFWSRQQDVLTQRVEDTCKWFLATPEFTHWVSDGAGILQCYGPPGIGKTVLASVVVDYLNSTVPSGCRVMAFYCDYADVTVAKYQILLGSLLQQLIKDGSSFWDGIKGLYKKHQHGTKPQAAEILTHLRAEVKSVRKVYLVFDALDEWSTDPDELSLLLSDLKGLGPNVRIIITSRPVTYINDLFDGDTRLELNPPKSDLETYLRSRLNQETGRGVWKQDIQLQEIAEHAILERCQGIFLLARLQIDQLSRQRHKRAFIKTLSELPKTPDALYDTALSRIQGQSEEDANLAKRVFAWIYYAREALTLGQLQYALAIQPGDNIIDQDGCVDGEVLTSICGGLVVLDKESRNVRFVHPTTRSYFQQHFERHHHQAEKDLALSCLTFFLSRTFTNLMASEELLMRLPLPNLLDSNELKAQRFESVEQFREISFLCYASRHMVAHFHSTQDDMTFNMIKTIFQNTEVLSYFWRMRMHYMAKAYYRDVSKVLDPDKLCIAAALGLVCVVEWLIESGCSPDQRSAAGLTPLYSATNNEQIAVVTVLLAKGADPNQPTLDQPQIFILPDADVNRTPMHCALFRGNLTIARVLKEWGASFTKAPFLLDPSLGASPLHLAVYSQSRPMVEFVLQSGPDDINSEDQNGDSPLHAAIERGAHDLVDLLLDNGASTSKPNSRGLLPIETAIVVEDWRVSDATCWLICKMIREHTPPTHHFLYSEQVQKHWARMKFRPHTLRNLRVHFWSNDNNGPNSHLGRLWECLRDGCSETADSVINELDSRTITPAELEKSNVLLYAVRRGWESTVRSLLRLADTLHCSARIKSLALCEAIESSHIDLASILLDHGADPNIPLDDGGTMLMAMADVSTEQSYSDLKFMLDMGADCNITGGPMFIAMTAAAASPGPKSLEVMETLRHAGAELNVSGGIYGTALIAATDVQAYLPQEKIKRLFEWGADPTIPGPKGTLAEIAARHPDATVHNLVIGTNRGFKSSISSDALIAAAASGTIEDMLFLIERGVDVNVEADFLGSTGTPLIAAVSAYTDDEVQKVQLLLGYGANINIPAIGYSNILQIYLDCKEPYLLVVRYLLEGSVDINAPAGISGDSTAFEIALRHYY